MQNSCWKKLCENNETYAKMEPKSVQNLKNDKKEHAKNEADI